MEKYLRAILFFLLLLCGGLEGYGQVTYESNGSCTATQLNYFSTPSCWNKSGSCNGSNFPPAAGTADCPIIVVLNHQIDLDNFTLGANVTLHVNTGGFLNISGNLTKSAETSGNIFVDGGKIEVGGDLILPNGKQNAKTKLSIDIRNGGTFSINGGMLDVRNDAELDISGDGEIESSLFAKSFEFGQRSMVNVLAGGGLIIEGLTEFTGNNSQINVTGFFRTGGVLIRGGAGNQLNTFGDAEVVIENDLDVRGNSDITFGGNSEVDIGGNIRVEGGSTVTATGTARVFVCGGYPDPNANGSGAVEELNGQFNPNCRILPVDFLFIDAEYAVQNRSVLITWATAKEWENSHFEIERSLNGIKDYKKVGEVEGMGWKDTATEYKFTDKTIPLGGGMVYYRLKQVDLGGNFIYSKVISVKTNTVQYTKGVWRAFPNPTTRGETFSLELMDPSEFGNEEINVRLVSQNASGQTFNGRDIRELSLQVGQVLHAAPKGVYVLELSWGRKVEHIKILKK